MIKRVAVCDACGANENIEHNLTQAPGGWFLVTFFEVLSEVFTRHTTVRTFCGLDCITEFHQQRLEREKLRQRD